MRNILRTVLAAIMAGAFGLGGVTACSSPGEDHQHHEGTDDHMADPYTQDAGVVAQGVTRVLLTWNPAQQASPLSVPDAVKEQTTGDLRAMLDKPSPDQVKKWTPKQWSDWKAAGARVSGFAETPTVQGSGDEKNVSMGFFQRLIYPDRSSSDWRRGRVDTTVTKSGQEWKVSSLTITNDH